MPNRAKVVRHAHVGTPNPLHSLLEPRALLEMALLCGLVALVGCVPAMRRLTALREHEVPVATWEPMVLTVSGCLLALSVLLAR